MPAAAFFLLCFLRQGENLADSGVDIFPSKHRLGRFQRCQNGVRSPGDRPAISVKPCQKYSWSCVASFAVDSNIKLLSLYFASCSQYAPQGKSPALWQGLPCLCPYCPRAFIFRRRSAMVCITEMAKCGVCCTRNENRCSLTGTTEQALFARADALRPLCSIKAISPKISPASSVSTTRAPTKISTSPSLITYRTSPGCPSSKISCPAS
jgi:hypothetical protein